MVEFPTFMGSWSWPWIRAWSLRFSSLIEYNLYTKFHRNRRNFLWTDGRTDGNLTPILLGRLPNFGSRPKKVSKRFIFHQNIQYMHNSVEASMGPLDWEWCFEFCTAGWATGWATSTHYKITSIYPKKFSSATGEGRNSHKTGAGLIISDLTAHKTQVICHHEAALSIKYARWLHASMDFSLRDGTIWHKVVISTCVSYRETMQLPPVQKSMPLQLKLLVYSRSASFCETFVSSVSSSS